MSQALLVCERELVNSLYEVNLRAYVATNVTIKKSIKESLELLSHLPNLDFIILAMSKLDAPTMTAIKEQFIPKIRAFGKKIPLIIVNSNIEEVSKEVDLGYPIIKLGDRYDIKGVIRHAAKILEISAKDMVNVPVGDYFPVPIDLINRTTKAFCELYIRVEEEDFEYDYLQVMEKEADVQKTIKGLTEDGFTHFYIDSELRLKFINHASQLVVTELNRKDIKPEEALGVSSHAQELIADELLLSQEFSPELVDISKACVDAVKGVIESAPKFGKLFKMLIDNKSGYIYQHTVMTTYFATKIIEQMSWGNREQVEKVSFVLFFHDLFLVPVFMKYPEATGEEDLLFNPDVSDTDKNLIMEHARMAATVLKTFPRCPMGADMILLQHHGVNNGQGFAVDFSDNLSPLAKVIIVAHELTDIFLKEHRRAQAENDKINVDKDAIIEELLEKYPKHTYKQIVKAIADIPL